MIKNIRYFFAQMGTNIRNAHALTGSFWIGVGSMILNDLTFFVIWFLFMKATGPINGWTSLDVFGMLGISILTFGFVNTLFYGIVELPAFVQKGTFDSVLLSPANIFLKLSGSAFSITAYGDLILGLFVVISYGILMNFSLLAWVIGASAILIGCVVFVCIRLLCSLVVFFIRDGEIISGQLMELFLRPSLYPGAIFPGKLKIFFMTVIPALLTSAMPIDAVKLHSIRLVLFGLGVMCIWLAITYIVFAVAVKRYESGNYLR